MNNSEYVLPYFVKHFERFHNYITHMDLTISIRDVELNLYVKKSCRYLRETLLKEPFFSRLIFKNGSLCAVFNAPAKYRGIIHTLAITGYNGSSKCVLKRMYEQQKTLATRKSSQGYFFHFTYTSFMYKKLEMKDGY